LPWREKYAFEVQKRIFVFVNRQKMRILTLFLASALISCNLDKKEPVETHQYTNDLIHETSPYLLQHAHNPVDWRAWNDETLKEAADTKKLMIVSIGYAACHWCHVMERESFEDSVVAKVMNEHFIPVKVDREERPDVDQVYINAVQLMTGSAGWPLNVITLPDGRPVWGGTYFKKDDWMARIGQIQKLYEENPEKLEEYAAKLQEGIKSMDLIARNEGDVDFASFDTSTLLQTWKKSFDSTYGGYNRAPKFMMPNNWHYLLRHAVQHEDKALLQHVNKTLTKMAYGGIYDHVGGGFSRYSVDSKWHIPHFEKMLYDNAQLVSLYSDAYLVTQNPLYEQVVYETLSFIASEMTNKEGGFYSSLDADSQSEEGMLEEGAFYTFTKEELTDLLNSDFELFAAYYNINEFGYWENGKYVLIRSKSDAEVETEFGLSSTQLADKKAAWKNVLKEYREKRPKPRLDDKSLTSWNALMLTAYVDAYRAFQKKEFLEAALANANFIKKYQFRDNGTLYHSYKGGKSTINGYLEDYAAVIDAFIALYEVTLEHEWLERAKELAEVAKRDFYDAESGMFHFTSLEDPALIARSVEYRDNVIPASNSILAKSLFKLSHYYDVPAFGTTARQMLKNVLPEIEQYPKGFSNWLDLLANYQFNFYEVVAVGPQAQHKIKSLGQYYLPNTLFAGSTAPSDHYLTEGRYVDGETFIYVCMNNTCKLPVRETEKAIESIYLFK
jgi:uncharacterized protein YyaL (SSP411 family)